MNEKVKPFNEIEIKLYDFRKAQDGIMEAQWVANKIKNDILKEFGLADSNLNVIDARSAEWRLKENHLVIKYIDHDDERKLISGGNGPRNTASWPILYNRRGYPDIVAVPAKSWDGVDSLYILKRDVPEE